MHLKREKAGYNRKKEKFPTSIEKTKLGYRVLKKILLNDFLFQIAGNVL